MRTFKMTLQCIHVTLRILFVRLLCSIKTLVSDMQKEAPDKKCLETANALAQIPLNYVAMDKEALVRDFVVSRTHPPIR